MLKLLPIVAILLGSCAADPQPAAPATQPSTRPTTKPAVEISFGRPEVPPPAYAPGEGDFTDDMLNREVTLGGLLEDTSAINLFRPTVYDGFHIRSQRLYVRTRVWQNPFGSIWCRVQAKIVNVDAKQQDKNEIEILRIRPIEMEPVNAAMEESVAWVEAHHKAIDLNRLKQTPDYAQWMEKIPAAKQDINRTPYRAKKEIVAVDPQRGFAEFFCGEHVLEEVVSHHGFYVALSVVYDLNARRIVRLIVDRSGFRLE